jgi:hypothetical protein
MMVSIERKREKKCGDFYFDKKFRHIHELAFIGVY